MSTDVDIKSAFKWQGVYYSVYMSNLANIQSKSDSIALINDSLLIDSANQSLILKLNQLTSDVKILTISNRNIENLTRKLKDEDLVTLIPKNQTLIDVELNEENEKVVNDIFLHTVAAENDKLSSDQVAQLENIIFQCPFSGGEAVYKARMLYSLVNDSISYDDYDLCILQGIAPRHSKPIDEIKFSLFPNPSSQQATLTYQLGEFDSGKFQMVDQLGRVICKNELSSLENNLLINIQEIPIGVYSYQLIVNGTIVSSKLFSIIR